MVPTDVLTYPLAMCYSEEGTELVGAASAQSTACLITRAFLLLI